MFADIPPIFESATIARCCEWVTATTGNTVAFFMQWYGLPAKISQGSVYRWDGGWVACEEKKDVLYFDALNCSTSVPLFADDGTLLDGRYYLVGLNTDNPYGFAMPMLIPFTLVQTDFQSPVELSRCREYLMYHPNTFGIMAHNGHEWAYANGYDVGLHWNYEHGTSVPEVRYNIGKAAQGEPI